MSVRAWCLVVAMVAACGDVNNGVPGPSMSASTRGLLTGMKLASDGRVFGVDSELLRTDDGYRGVVRGLPIDLHGHPGRVYGHVGVQPVDLHVTYDAEQLTARGMF